MSHRRYCLLLLPGLLLLFTGLSHCESQAKCYDVDGRVVEGDAPCNPDAENSPCCGLYWTCLDTGVCTQESTKQILRHEETLLARGTCTDRSWASAQCPNFCLGDSGRGITLSDTNSTFCCQEDLGSPCTPDPVVKTLKPGKALTTIGIRGSSTLALSTLRLPSSSAFSQSISVSTSQATDKASISTRSTDGTSIQQNPTTIASAIPPKPSPGSQALPKSAKIGLGVGIPVLVVSIALTLVVLWFRRRAQRKAIEDAKNGSNNSQGGKDWSPAVDYAIMGYAPHELDESEQKVELPSKTTIPRGELMGSQFAAQLLPNARHSSGQLQSGRVELMGSTAERQGSLVTDVRSHK